MLQIGSTHLPVKTICVKSSSFEIVDRWLKMFDFVAEKIIGGCGGWNWAGLLLNFVTTQLFSCPGKFKFFLTAFLWPYFTLSSLFRRNESWQSTTRHIQRQFDLPYKEIWCGGEMFQIILIFRRWSSISLREDSISISTLQCLWSLLGTWKKKVRNITQYVGKIKKVQ